MTPYTMDLSKAAQLSLVQRPRWVRPTRTYAERAIFFRPLGQGKRVLHDTGTADRRLQAREEGRHAETGEQRVTSTSRQSRRRRGTRSSSRSKTNTSPASRSFPPLVRYPFIGAALTVVLVTCVYAFERLTAGRQVYQRLPPAPPRGPPAPTVPRAIPSPFEVPQPVSWNIPREGEALLLPVPEPSASLPLTRASAPPKIGESVSHALRGLGGTNAVFHGPSCGKGGFTPPFQGDMNTMYACVNAGNNALWIGGGGINGEIAAQLMAEAQRHKIRMTPAQLSEVTSQIHQEALRKAEAHAGTLVRVDPPADPNVSPFRRVFAFVARDGKTWSDRQTGENVAAVFIDELRREFTPLGNPRNAYVVYTVPPHGSAPDAHFLPAYEQTYTNIVTALNLFNRFAVGSPRIARVRIPLLSGGIFAGERSAETLGRHAMRALQSVLQRRGTDVTLDFAWDRASSFLRAAQDLEQP